MPRRTLVLILLLTAAAARAGTDLRWEPRWSSLAPQTTASISVHIDDPQPLRTVEVWATYDPDVVVGLSAEPGALFDGVPCFLWEGYEEPAPGEWHGYVVIIGGDCETVGPGELLRWTFETGSATGSTRVETLQVDLYDPDAQLLPDVRLPAATLAVSPTPTAVPDAPALALSLAPNPFNPRTRITLRVPDGAPARLEVRDLRGRLRAVPWRGTGSGEPIPVDWHAADLASGAYVLRLITADGAAASTRATLVR